MRIGSTPTGPVPFALIPLIFSAGRDHEPDIFTDNFGTAPVPLHYADPTLFGSASSNAPNPYSYVSNGTVSVLVGTPGDTDFSGKDQSLDNITNHYQQTP